MEPDTKKIWTGAEARVSVGKILVESLGVDAVPRAASPSLGVDAGALLGRLRDGPLTADELMRSSALDPAAASAALMELELAGAVALEDGVYRVSV